MKLDWGRIKRTAIQSGSGAGIALVTALCGNFEKQAVITALVTFVGTVAIAVLMNIQKQADDACKEAE